MGIHRDDSGHDNSHVLSLTVCQSRHMPFSKRVEETGSQGLAANFEVDFTDPIYRQKDPPEARLLARGRAGHVVHVCLPSLPWTPLMLCWFCWVKDKRGTDDLSWDRVKSVRR